MRTSIALMAICLIISGCSRNNDIPTMFSAPDGVTYKYDASIEHHSFNWGDGYVASLFMISPNPAGLSKSMVRGMADQTGGNSKLTSRL